MGLKLTLSKEDNHMYYDFVDAYWVVTNVGYTTTDIGFELICCPTREAYHKNQSIIPTPKDIRVGGTAIDIYSPILYRWTALFPISSIFPNGIPLEQNAQLTAIYNFIKSYTDLPFEDVLEN